MNKEEIKKRIREEIIDTVALVNKYRDLTKPIAPENAIGRVSRMDAINNKSVNEAALRKAETKLTNLEVALTKVDDPDFGICIRCKNQIPLGRIMLLPHTVTCVNCAK
ncbi:TraR/DksA C4-type zinc finger protein [Aureitalea sp. L0-47]|uniref:TraR/DksA family transcriptional regulator n=1 Tax=Aureitalea sp. L0-47 TaxID=2816962 RepID=UPI0022375B11|nr:TraR/DksA C4-type zinc finger protein [Aureitalea sp. L0-47]MCW5520810.1 TraR/DksA C4-type zinc finger protein [Aureitalea sp. L0-47]